VPLVVTHGWPGSVVEFHKVIAPLTDPVANGDDASDAFHLVCPTLPGFGFSGKPECVGWGTERIADAWDQLMTRLGYPRYGAQGGDWGSRVTMDLRRRHPDAVVGIHVNMVPAIPAAGSAAFTADDLTESERAALAAQDYLNEWGRGYAIEQSTRPQTVGYGLVDSPAGLCGWIIEKFWAWSDCADDPASVFSKDELLDNIMLYWLPASGASAARIYWESYRTRNLARVPVPTGCSIFPKEIYRPSRRWAEPLFPDLRYWNELESGGHFAAFEQPSTFVHEVRAAFRQFR
jgi:pimeloyl-ACP methyl ester carboxylesterase